MDNVSRREFVKKSAKITALTTVCLCGLEGCATYSGVGSTPSVDPAALDFSDNTLTIELAREPNLGSIGVAVKVIRPDLPDGMIVAHVDTDRFEAVSLACTHRGVEVEYDHDMTNFQCASIGNSMFAIDGENISGPARRPLTNYDAILENGNLIIRM